ncbi:hypothetical protein LTR56_021748 [Elasticomyces elasticus]|nr:hypothetical protein LTR56_021748 [Elasticomyces elasticus]KAK3630694.1 hypothetical protein LTR22_021389 [Elasticomyces elasticus]KAK4909114.1 hypothetical protein LTR49_022085 [Elasticomyces elasticus]KAK5749253.1 hypothetical protein LTS12_020695 [Elasticomyces elasticus]
MATTAPPRLLSVPREIRNQIYEECLLKITISKAASPESAALSAGPPWRPRVKLSRTTGLSLLLVCTQIHDECMEQANDIKPSALLVNLAESNMFKPTKDLNLIVNIPAAVLKRVKRCRLTISWIQIIDGMASDSGFHSWFSQARSASTSRLADLLQQSTTPTKTMCDGLRMVLTLVHDLIDESAHVTIAASFGGHPDFESSFPVSRKAYWQQLLGLFHVPTFLALHDDEAIIWPPSPKLSMTCCVATPLYITRRSGNTGDLPEYITKNTEPDSTVMVIWELTPSTDSNNWQGFQPTMIGTSDQILFT